MRISIDRYRQADDKIRRRALALVVAGSLIGAFGAFWLLIVVLHLFTEPGDLRDKRAVMVLGLFVGVLPGAGGAVMLGRGIAGRRRLARLRDLVTVATVKPNIGVDELAHALGLGVHESGAIVVDARSLGIVEHDPVASTQAGAAQHAPAAPMLTAPAPGTTTQGRALAATAWAAPPTVHGLIGAVLQRTYRIEALLGSGGMGAVYAACNVRTGRRYAVKTLLPDARMSPDAIRRFEREAALVGAIGHPGIVAVHDFDETEHGMHYLVMDLLEGETLERRLARVGSLRWPETMLIASQIGAALAAAHDRSVMHRDLKPANVFLTRAAAPAPGGAAERAVLLDFGLAKRLDDAAVSRLTTTGAVVGTPLYMSPEQARGEAMDVRSDVYALGAVIYEMVTGAPPFLDATLASVYARLLTESAPAASRLARSPCPPGLDAVLDRALAKDRTARFPDVRSLLAALSTIDRHGWGQVVGSA